MPITIDYSQSIDVLVSTGHYDIVNDGVSENGFTKSIQDQRDTVITRKAILLNLNRVLSSEDVVTEMTMRGLRPATVRELLTFGHTYPKLQRKIDVVALGSQEAVYLWGDLEELRGVGMERWSRHWHEDFWFLAFSIDS